MSLFNFLKNPAFAQEIKLPGVTPIVIKGPLAKFSSIGDVISEALKFIFPLAGLILFGAILYSGFQLLISGGDPKKAEGAKGCLTNAVIGFIIVLTAWWLAQIVGYILGIPILK